MRAWDRVEEARRRASRSVRRSSLVSGCAAG